MRLILLTLAIFLFNSCANNANLTPKKVDKSWYLNKKLIDFEINNGFCYSYKSLENGNSICYYRSDKGSIVSNLFNEDSFPYCELALYLNKDKVIKKIEILEDDIKCAYILR